MFFKSSTPDRATPEGLYDELNNEFHFDFDPCPLDSKFDGLLQDWGNSNFVNPPYGKTIPLWLSKGIHEFKKCKTSVFLLPARTDTKWFHNLALEYATEIRFLKGRLTFKGCKHPAPFPSILVIYKGD